MTDVSAQPLRFAPNDEAEELARAELYGLLARLWFAPPDEALLAQFRVAVTQAPQEGGWLEAPWERLVAALRDTTPAQAQAEYDALFGGVGKPEIFRYGSYYLAGFLNEKPLVKLRSDLARLGLARQASHAETEDHISLVFEVMRYLIAGDDVLNCQLPVQRQFFKEQVQTWVERLCDAVASHPAARLTVPLAELTRVFVQVEAQAFDMTE